MFLDSRMLCSSLLASQPRRVAPRKNLLLAAGTVAFVLLFCSASWAAIGIDANVSKDSSAAGTTITTPAFSTVSGNELLLAFVSADYGSGANTTVTGMAGGGLSWALVRRTNVQNGTAEIWRAFAAAPLSNATVTATLSQSGAASLTLISFTGVDATTADGSGAVGATGSGNARPGAPTATLTTTRNSSWVFGVGTDWDRSAARTPGAGQSLVHQYRATVGDTYWVQMQNAATLLSGTAVTINDTAPTNDRYNLTTVEILAAAGGGGGSTFTVSGSVTPAAIGNGATLTLSQSGTTVATATADSSGNFTLSNISNGSYTVTPSKSGQTFTPASQSFTVNGAAVSGINFAAVTYAITGTVSPATVGSSTTITLSGGATGTVIGDGSGGFAFSVPNGTYTITPSKTGYNFTPASSTVTVNGAAMSGVNFAATAVGNSISGSISPTANGVGTLMTLSGAASANTTADATAAYRFSGLAPGTYTVTPSKSGFTFTPGSATVTITTADLSGVNFTAAAASASSISGTVSPAGAGAGALVTLSPFGYAIADSSGNFSFTSLPGGTYTLTAERAGFTFSPAKLTVVLNGTASSGNNFTGAALPPSPLNYPDLSDLIPASAMSIVGSGANRVFQYTHDTFEGGNGPLEIQPALNPASGNYQGMQHIYSFNNGIWRVEQSIPVAGAFVFDSAHLHFHFPFVTYGLYNSNADGSIGSLVAPSVKDGFCIDNSFIYDQQLPNAGFGTWGSCSNPTTLRGLSVGAVDEYDQTDFGQAITIGNLADGMYWLRALVDPNNFLVESDKSNNETDVQMQFTGNTVKVLQILKPVLPPPPSVTVTAPANGAQVSGAVQITATTPSSGGSGVQFLLDGLPFGSVVTSAPYTVPWDTTGAPNGTHWLAAQYTDATGRVGTSAVAAVSVANGGTSAPVVTVTEPDAGTTVSSVIIVAANVASANPIASVQFYVDGSPIGPPATAAPYSAFWNTETYSPGTHTVTATAIDSLGGSGASTPVSVTVDNSTPANLIGIDKVVFKDGSGTMTTPAFSTTTNSDLLIAFVSLDGPGGSPQTATVSGAGLTWTLLKRSNTEQGDSEIWAAKSADFIDNATVIAQPGVSGYHGTLTVVAFTNAAGPGMVNQISATTGAPDIYIPGVSAGNWVFAVGNDWDNSIARTPVAGQYLVHQRVDTTAGDTYWVQATTAPSAATALVDIHDSAPTGDRWNYCAVEIVATRQ